MISADLSRTAESPVVDDFIERGVHRFPEPVNPQACAALLADLKSDRAWGSALFLEEAAFDADPQYRGVNPRPGRNLLDRFADRLAFVEQAPQIVDGLTAVLGQGYRILDRKVVCGVPDSAMPAWLKARIAGNGVAGDHAAAVVPHDGHVLEAEQVDRTTHAVNVVGDRQRSVLGVAAGAGTRQVQKVAGDVVDEMGEQEPKRGAAHGPAVHEQHVGPGADAPVRDLAAADVEETIGLLAEQVGCLGGGEAHAALASWIFAAVARSK
jgi:hypothetical protein